MHKFRSLLKMFGRMTLYGILLGAIAGFLVGMVILQSGQDPLFDGVKQSLVGVLFTALMWGGIFGGMYGGTAGLASGFVMALVTAIAFREIRDVKRFTRVMGLITGVMTSGVFILGELWSFGVGLELTWAGAMVMSVVIAVYASQMTARKYVHEMGTSIRKQKITV